MRNQTGIALVAVGLTAVAMIVAPVWAGSGNGKLMHMTMHTTMHMSGMPAMPPRTIEHDVCMPAGKFDPDAIRRATSRNSKEQCSVEHFVKHGNEITYDVMCKGAASVTVHTVAHLDGDDAFTGKSHATINAEGHAMTMDNGYTAKRIGSCTYTPPASS